MDFRDQARFAADVRREEVGGASAATMGVEERRIEMVAVMVEEMRILATDVAKFNYYESIERDKRMNY